MARRLSVLVLVVAVAVVSGYSRAALERLDGSPAESELLYLPSGKHLRLMSLGHEMLVADLMYLWAIQYYSNYAREDRQRWVKHIFSDVITELDPRYIDAYWMGALIMILDNDDLEGGIALLEKGADRNPDKWILPYLAAWECYHAGQFDCAVAFFERAAATPGAPVVVSRMRAGMLAASGDLRQALGMWRAILEDPGADAQSVRIAERKVRDLRTRADIEDLESAASRFRDDNRRWPEDLEELVQASYIGRLPQDPDDNAYFYDAKTGRVNSPTGRVLGDN